MTAGRLASVKPGATTNTFLYRCPIDKAASTVLSVTNSDASSTSSYRVALRDYDFIFELDTANYNFRKGNVISSYIVTVTPGVQADGSLSPGDIVTTTDKNVTFKYLDVLASTDTINIPVKVKTIGTANLFANVPDFEIGDTVTGADTGLTAVIYGTDIVTGDLTLQIDPVSAVSTSFILSDVTNVSNGDALFINGADTEIVAVSNVTGNTVTVTRGQYGTTGIIHNPGLVVQSASETATSTTLTAAVVDTNSLTVTVASTTGFTVGQLILIDNEFMEVTLLNGNTVTVVRGAFGSTAATHTSTTAVDVWDVNGYTNLKYFASGETIESGAVSGVIDTYVSTADPFDAQLKFVYDLLNTNLFSLPVSLPLNLGRVYRFTQEDATNDGYELQFSIGQDGISEYTTGVTSFGIAGTVGSYTEITVDAETDTGLYIKTIEPGFGIPAGINSTPLFQQIYVYDVDGAFSPSNSSFTTNSGDNTVTAVNIGPYGYVQNFSTATKWLKVSLGSNSIPFENFTRTITGVDTEFTITVSSNTGLILGMAVSGTGIGTGAIITEINSTTITLSVANTATVSGSGVFKYRFYDSPLEPATVRTYPVIVDLSPVDNIEAEDYLYYNNELGPYTTHKNSSIIVGPGQSIVVYSEDALIGYNLNGFEDATNDYDILLYSRVATDQGGGGTGP